MEINWENPQLTHVGEKVFSDESCLELLTLQKIGQLLYNSKFSHVKDDMVTVQIDAGHGEDVSGIKVVAWRPKTKEEIAADEWTVAQARKHSFQREENELRRLLKAHPQIALDILQGRR